MSAIIIILVILGVVLSSVCVVLLVFHFKAKKNKVTEQKFDRVAWESAGDLKRRAHRK